MDLLSGHALNVPLVDLTAPDIHSTCCDSRKEKETQKVARVKVQRKSKGRSQEFKVIQNDRYMCMPQIKILYIFVHNLRQIYLLSFVSKTKAHLTSWQPKN